MTRLFNDPSDFAGELTEGFVAAHHHWVRQVHGGVVRAQPAPAGEVAVVIGGGSGHYPAFAGLVGSGIAHGAAMGNLFASPSAQQVYSVAKAADSGGGVLLTFGNYAGDVLHFGLAQERLRAEGIECQTVLVTDDISSGSRDEIAKRRGIAGDLVVFKIAGAAAAEGRSLSEVAAAATRANDRTRSLGVAFAGCTLPGADAPLFTVPQGRMSVGMGIHGEPGVSEADVPSADGLAELFVSSLLAELPDGVRAAGGRVGLILNGLGTVKYEELFVVYRRVARLLTDAGVTVVEPEVGELVTSFDMAGASLTLTWLDDELEALWRAPADTPALRKGSISGPAGHTFDSTGEWTEEPLTADAPPHASAESQAATGAVVDALAAIAAVVDDNVDELGRIDAVAGDGDHGIGMQRGSGAALDAGRAAAEQGAGAGTALARAADAWSDRGGGTSGALWGVALLAVGRALGDDDAPSAQTVTVGVRAAADAVVRIGGARLGDKTMVDALLPFADELERRTAAGSSLADAWADAAEVAQRAADDTAQLVPQLGRARPLAERSVGTPDAGAVSLALIVRAVGEIIAGK